VSLRQAALVGCAAVLLSGTMASGDAKSDALVKKAREVMAGARTLQADMALTMTGGGDKQTATMKLRLMRPSYLDITATGLPGGTMRIISDGKDVYRVNEGEKQYKKMPASGLPSFLGGAGQSPMAMFFSPQGMTAGGTHKFGGTAKANGKSYQVVHVTTQEAPKNRKLYLAPNGWVEGIELSDTESGAPDKITMWLKNVRVNAPMKAEEFAYAPPEGFEMPKGPEESLLEVGKPAPSFLLPQPGGGQLSLEEARKGKEAVLINFWFYS
jgi:outer membrane lipoprotein-sorting protein